MQDIHALGGTAGGAGGGGRLFAGGSSGGDRRLRPHNTQNQSLKCPRCDSVNTKFCYYNNYNLSQPRHFCKGCKRYWTKGGVLRNVPVGGGCRKAKRSKLKQQAGSGVEADVTSTPDTGTSRYSKKNSNSSSDSSSLTVTTTVAEQTAVVGASGIEDASVTVNSSSSATNLLTFPQSGFFDCGNRFDQHQPLTSQDFPTDGQIFSGTGSFTSLMTSPGESSLLGFNMAGVSTYGVQENHHGTVVQDQRSISTYGVQENHHGIVVQDQRSTPVILTRGSEELEMDCGYLDDHSGFGNLQQSRLGVGGLMGMEWQINGEEGLGVSDDHGLFNFCPGDDQAYLLQNHRPDNDPSLNFPPLV